MYHQKPNPFPADWWGEMTRFGISRNSIALALLVVGLILVIIFVPNWDWVMGRR